LEQKRKVFVDDLTEAMKLDMLRVAKKQVEKIEILEANKRAAEERAKR